MTRILLSLPPLLLIEKRYLFFEIYKVYFDLTYFHKNLDDKNIDPWFVDKEQCRFLSIRTFERISFRMFLQNMEYILLRRDDIFDQLDNCIDEHCRKMNKIAIIAIFEKYKFCGKGYLPINSIIVLIA